MIATYCFTEIVINIKIYIMQTIIQNFSSKQWTSNFYSFETIISGNS